MRIEPEKDALLVVDLQPDFMPGGALAVAGGDEIVRPIAELARRFRTVVATQDFHPQDHVPFASTHGRPPFSSLRLHGQAQTLWPDHCVAGTPGAALHAGLPDTVLSLILRKGTRAEVDSYSGFFENVGANGNRASTGLGPWLRARGIGRVFIVGLARDYCVRATALDAVAEGFETIVVDDLTRAVAPLEADRVSAELREHHVGSTLAEELS